MTRLSLAAFFVLSLGAALPASAASVLVENFLYGKSTVLNAPDSHFNGNWKTTNGTVDYLHSQDTFGELCGGALSCVDLDGSSQDAGKFETAQVFGPGIYSLTFQLLGNQRSADADLITIIFGGLMHSFALAGDGWVDQDTFGNLFKNIVIGAKGTTLSFENDGGDNFGAILKSVSIDRQDQPAPVPLPAAGVLLLSGLAGFAALRRRANAA